MKIFLNVTRLETGQLFTQGTRRGHPCTKGIFFPRTVRDWNAIPDSLILSAEDAEDCVAKFTSLVRARDKFPNHRSW